MLLKVLISRFEVVSSILEHTTQPDEIFINGDSFVKGYIPIESEFKTFMEG